MKSRTWMILGATSIIAEKFAHIAARHRHELLLVGRTPSELAIIAADITLRYHVKCDTITIDFAKDTPLLMQIMRNHPGELDVFIAYSQQRQNSDINDENMTELVDTNIKSTLQLIHIYLQKPQNNHHLIFLSSVAADRGRGQNSLYGASKAAVDIYLQGLQQTVQKTQHITIARLGFIDTRSTYGKPGIFYAASPEECANACWIASRKKRLCIYYPRFWSAIMWIIKQLPWKVYTLRT